MPMKPYAIELDSVWKRYGLPMQPFLRRQFDRLRGRGAQSRDESEVWALRDISLTIEPGESVGIVGRNGAGKSTLLRLIAGVSPATRGQLSVVGRLFPMIELGAGIHRDLTGRENIKLLSAIMGLTPRQIAEKQPDIEEFAELGDWIRRPVWQYSSGMQARLGFSVAAHIDADVLLIDEVLAVGDINFQKKCLSHLDALSKNGTTIVFVTHNPHSIQRICQKAVYLKEGRLAAQGSPRDVLNAYVVDSMGDAPGGRKQDLPEIDQREGTGAFRIESITMHDAHSGCKISRFEIGDSVRFRVALQVREPTAEYNITLRLVDSASAVISSVDIPVAALPKLALRRDCVLECLVDNINLLHGRYWVDVTAREPNDTIIDSASYLYSFDVVPGKDFDLTYRKRGLVYYPAHWRLAD